MAGRRSRRLKAQARKTRNKLARSQPVRRVPVLDDRTGGNLDWVGIAYLCDVWLQSPGRVIVENRLSGANVLNRLVKTGHARWVLEVRSFASEAFLVKLLQAEPGESDLNQELPPEMLEFGQVTGFPGLIATKDCRIPSDATGLNPAWQALSTEIVILKGAWLVRGRHHQLKTLLDSILKFKSDDSLKEGTMKVQFATGSGLYWNVRLHPDYFNAVLRAHRGDPLREATLMSAFTAVLADANKREEFVYDDEGERLPIAQSVLDNMRAKDPNCPDFGKEFDPLYAASLLLDLSFLYDLSTQDLSDRDGR